MCMSNLVWFKKQLWGYLQLGGSPTHYSGFSWAKRPRNLSSVFPHGKLLPSDLWPWSQLKYQEILVEADVGKMWIFQLCNQKPWRSLSFPEQIEKARPLGNFCSLIGFPYPSAYFRPRCLNYIRNQHFCKDLLCRTH